jgi:hypothetical protein
MVVGTSNPAIQQHQILHLHKVDQVLPPAVGHLIITAPRRQRLPVLTLQLTVNTQQFHKLINSRVCAVIQPPAAGVEVTHEHQGAACTEAVHEQLQHIQGVAASRLLICSGGVALPLPHLVGPLLP